MQARAFKPAAVRGCVSRTPVRVVARTVDPNKKPKESRIGRAPITIPKGVSATLDGSGTTLKVKVDGVVRVSKLPTTTKLNNTAMSQHGLSRSLAFNMINGVATGFSKRLEMVGTGYRATTTADALTLNVGYSLPRILAIPKGLKVTIEKSTALIILGPDKVVVGDFCATIRRQRPPEPYKGKGVRFAGEVIKLKEGKGAGGKKK